MKRSVINKEMRSTAIVNTNATNSLLIMITTKKKKEKEKTSSSIIQVSDRLKNSLNQMEIDGKGYEDILWRLIQYWDVGHGTNVPAMNKNKK